MNDLYNLLGNSTPLGNIGALMKQFQQFRQMFQGDPRQQVQQLLNSGRVTQEQYNLAVKKANELYRMMR